MKKMYIHPAVAVIAVSQESLLVTPSKEYTRGIAIKGKSENGPQQEDEAFSKDGGFGGELWED